LYQIGDVVSIPAVLAASCPNAMVEGDGCTPEVGEVCGIRV